MDDDQDQNNMVPENRRFVELSRQIVDETTVKVEYQTGYTMVTVKSAFTGLCPLGDVIAAIALRKLGVDKTERKSPFQSERDAV